MKGIYVQKHSPYYWLRYYDILEPDPNKRRKSVNTKIPITEADLKRMENARFSGEKVKLIGTMDTRKIAREFGRGLAERALQAKTGVRLIKTLSLSEGFTEFKADRSIPGSKKFLKPKTFESYDLAVSHFKKAAGDKLIYKYQESDYKKLLFYFEEKKLSRNSRSIYTRGLHSLWKYFVEKKYTNRNLIEIITHELKEPEPIPLDEMRIILSYLKDENKTIHFYQIIYFMLLTGCRPSSAMLQLKENIDFKKKVITIQNVKTGEKKGKPYYKFPLYKELYNLLIDMKADDGNPGRVFHMYSVVPENYTWPLSFWDRKIYKLLKDKKIRKKYTLKQIRPTFSSFLINVLKMDIFLVQRLLDHTNIKVTDQHYVDLKISNVRKNLDGVTINDFAENDEN